MEIKITVNYMDVLTQVLGKKNFLHEQHVKYDAKTSRVRVKSQGVTCLLPKYSGKKLRVLGQLQTIRLIRRNTRLPHMTNC
jgi:hypothetical protein